jgi:hypothetical protein
MADYGFSEKGLLIAGQLVATWEEIDKERNAFRFANSVLVKVGFRYGRVSEIEDQVIYDRDEWAKIKAALEGTTAFFCDFAGKHSQTDVEFWSNVDLEEITDHEEIIAFHKIHGFSNCDLDIIGEGLHQAIENGEIDEDYNKLDS